MGVGGLSRDRGDEPQAQDTYDSIVGDLRELRVSAGVIPYAEIARRIGRHRGLVKGDGANHAPARSTVYDAFRLGRSRLNADLVGEIVQALGEDEQSLRRWKHRCYQAQASCERNDPSQAISSPDRAEPTVDTEPQTSRRSRYIYITVVLLACLLLNAFGHAIVGKLHLSLFLDMVGTAAAAIMLGPWYGVAIALLGNATGMAIHGYMALPFALVNAAGALVWGYGVRRSAWGSTLTQFFRLNLTVAVVCTIVAVPILMLGFHGGTGHEADQLTHTFTSSGQNMLIAVLFSNGITSVLDKLATGFIALIIIQGCVSRMKTVDPTFSTPVDNFFRSSDPSTLSIMWPARLYSAVYAHTFRTHTFARSCGVLP